MEGNNGNAPQKEQLNEEAERQISEIEEKVAKKKSGFWKEVKEWVVALVVALLVVFWIVAATGNKNDHGDNQDQRIDSSAAVSAICAEDTCFVEHGNDLLQVFF